MNIINAGLYTNSVTSLKNNRLNQSKNNNITNTISNNYNMPALAPNYLAKINFRGKLDWKAIADYTTDMGKRIYSKRNVTEFANIHKNASGITEGRGLPEEWLSRIENPEKFDKDNFITEFGECFEKERNFSDVDRLNDDLTNLFTKNGIIDEKTPLSVKYIGHGFQAWAYKIGIGKDENKGVVAKLFKRDNNYLQNHGNHTEQNLAEYVKNYAGDKSEFVKYYYGDTKHGLMVVDYLPPNIEKPKDKLDLSDIGVGYGDDFPKNRINGYICDFGGIETVSNLVGNKLAQDVHSAIKYAETPEKKVEIFNDVISKNDGSDDFKDKAIGLVHGIKHMPKEMQPELYQKCYDLKSHRVNIALIQNIKNFERTPVLDNLTEKLVTNVDDIKAVENIAKEIKHVPDKLRHKFFEEQTDTKHSATIKYLARNINQYYKDMPNRVHIYQTFSDNADPYASVALINSMKYMGSSRYGEYFEKFFSKNDDMVNTSLARSIDLLNDDKKLQQKWIDKLLACDNDQVTTGLCEVVPFINDELKVPLYDRLLNSKDKVAKEFLAENLTSIPGYKQSQDWISRLLDGADNMVRGTIANTVKDMPEGKIKKDWSRLVSDGADNSVRDKLSNRDSRYM